MIKEIKTKEEIGSSVSVIQRSFITVANELGLTIENCPSNAAFIKEEQLEEMKQKGCRMFGLFEGDQQIGFMSLKKATTSLYYLEKLAVLPEKRHGGYGKLLMDHALDFVKKEHGEKISIGIINENIRLKNWYIHYSFKELETKKFPHLPFTVCILEKQLSES